tara:strand:- start:486 stop:872 length:387 start_codon:yes stop_codon:yes gene_type:complete
MSDFLNKNKVLLIGSAIVFAAIYFFGAFESCQSSDEVATVNVPANVGEPMTPAITTIEAVKEAQPQKIEPVVVADEVVIPVPNANIQPELGKSDSPEASTAAVEDVVTSPTTAVRPISASPKVDLNNK